MTDGQAAPKKGMNPILKWLLIGCGTLVLIVILAFASCVYIFKKSVYDPAKEGIAQAKTELAKEGVTVDTSKGMAAGFQSAAYGAMVKGMISEGKAVVAALPAGEQAAANDTYKALGEKAAQLTPTDMTDLMKAHSDYQNTMLATMQSAANGKPAPPDPAASRTLVEKIQEVVARH